MSLKTVTYNEEVPSGGGLADLGGLGRPGGFSRPGGLAGLEEMLQGLRNGISR